jgi:phage terminase Nu1 subunit (DNA packaging protein)
MAHLFLSNTRWSDYRMRGVFSELPGGGYDLDACRESYIKHLRDQAAGRSGSAGENLSQERARQARLVADAQEMKNRVRRGELLEVSRVIEEYASDLAGLRAALLNIPGHIGQEFATMSPAEAAARVADLIDDALTTMREVDEVTAKVQVDQAWGSESLV